MADTKHERLLRWRSRLQIARKMREDWETRFRVQELERYWLGRHTEDRDESQQFWLNHFFATIQAQLPALLSRTTHFLVRPKLGQAQPPIPFEAAKVHEAILRSIADRDENLHNDSQLAIAQAFFRLGVLKVAYDPHFEPNPRFGEEEEGTSDVPGVPRNDEPREVLTDEVYTFEWVDACKMLLPDEGPNMRRWRWIAEEITVSMDEARHDDRIRRGLRGQLQANATARTEEQGRGFSVQAEALDSSVIEEDHERFTYTEIYDCENKRLLAIADGQLFSPTEFLFDQGFPPGIDDHPYAILRFIPIQGSQPSPWPKPVTFDWLPLQQHYNLLREMDVNAARRAARKYLYDDSTFPDEEEVDKFNSPADMQGVRISDLGRPPMMFGESGLNSDVARQSAFLLQDWAMVTGASGNRINQPDAADTATEAVIIEQAATMRDNAARIIVDKWLGCAGLKMLQLVRQTLTLDMWVQIRGFSDREFQEWLQRPAVQTMLTLFAGPAQLPAFIAALEVNPALQERFRQRYGHIKPLRVSRSELIHEIDVQVLPSAARPLQQAQLLRLASVLGPLAFTSPTFMEELLGSFDLPQGDRIAEEIMLHVRQQAQQQQALPQGQAVNGTRAGERVGPLGAVSANLGGRVGI